MLLEDSRGRKFTKLVSNHVFGDKNRIKNFAVVNEERVANELWRDRRAARPGLDRFLHVTGIHFVDLVENVLINKRTFFKRTTHSLIGFYSSELLLFRFSTLNDERVARLILPACFESLGQLSPR